MIMTLSYVKKVMTLMTLSYVKKVFIIFKELMGTFSNYSNFLKWEEKFKLMGCRKDELQFSIIILNFTFFPRYFLI